MALALLITPTVMLVNTVAATPQTLSEDLHDGSLTIPPPPASVREWPLIGEE